jgi:hypothetical protein
MHQVKLVIQLHQRFGGAEKEVSAEIQVIKKMADYL